MAINIQNIVNKVKSVAGNVVNSFSKPRVVTPPQRVSLASQFVNQVNQASAKLAKYRPTVQRIVAPPPINRSNQSPLIRRIGQAGEQGAFGPLPQLAAYITRVKPETALPISHFVAGADPTGLGENFATGGQMLPEKEKYRPLRIAGGATAGLLTGGPKALLGQAGIGTALGGVVKAGENLIKGRPLREDVGKSALEGSLYGAQTSATFNLVNGLLGSLGSKVPFLRGLSEQGIAKTLPTKNMTIGQAFGKIGRTGLKRIVRAALLETPIEGMIYGVKERGENQKLLDSIANQTVQNLLFNVGFAGVNTAWDAKVMAPIIKKSVDQVLEKYPQFHAENIPLGLSVKPKGGQAALLDAEAKKGEADLGAGKKVPTIKVGEMNIEEPVAKAVSKTFDEGTASSGFHRSFNKSFNGLEPGWAIVYKTKPSAELIEAATKAGLEVRTRPNGITDVYLPKVSRGTPEEAKKVFDKFADIYATTKEIASETVQSTKMEQKSTLDIAEELSNIEKEKRQIYNQKPVGETTQSYLNRNPELKERITQINNAQQELFARQRNSQTQDLGLKQRGLYRQIEKDPNTSPEIKSAVSDLPQFYAPRGQKPIWDDARRQVAENPELVEKRLLNSSERSSDERTALFIALSRKYFQDNKPAQATEILRVGAEEATMSGQATAAWALWSRMTPEGMVKWAERHLEHISDKDSLASKLIKSGARKLGLKTKATGTQTREIAYDVSKNLNRINKEAIKQVIQDVKQGTFDFFNKTFDSGLASTKRTLTSAGSLSRRIQNALNSKTPKDQPIKDMINTLYSVAKEELPKEVKTPRDPLELIKLALKNKSEYQNVFELTQKRIMDTYKNKPEELKILQPFLDKIFIEPFSKSQGEKAMGMKLKELGVDMSKLIKEHYSTLEATKEDLLLKMQAETGLTKEELKPLADFVSKRFDELTRIEKEKYLERVLGEKKIKEPKEKAGTKSLTQELIELSNTGAFRDQKYYEAIAKKLGVPTMTPDLSKKIYQKMSTLQTVTDPLKRREIITDVFDDINKATPPGLSEVIDVMRYNGMLSGWKTQLRNIWGNFFNLAGLRPLILGVESTNDWIGSTLRGKERQRFLSEVPAYYKGFINAFPEAITAFSQGWNQIARSEDPDLRSLRTRMYPKKFTFASRALEGMDRLSTTLATAGEYAALQARGMSGDDAMQIAKNTAEQMIYRNKLDPKNVTGQGHLLSAYDKALTGIEKIAHDFPIIKWVVPFIRIGGMIMKESLQYTPVVGSLTKAGASGEKATQQTAKSLIGYGVMLGAMKLAMDGRTTWETPKDEEQRRLFYDSGRLPYSVKVGDKWVPMDYFGPLKFAIGLPAAMQYYAKEDPKAFTKVGMDKLTEVAMKTLKGQLRLMSQSTFLGGFDDFLKLVSGDEDIDVQRFVTQVVSSVNPYQGALRGIAQLIDPIFRKPSNPIETLLKDLPILSTLVPAYQTSLGGPSKREPGNSLVPFDLGQEKSEMELPYQLRVDQLQQNAINTQRTKDAEKYILEMKGADTAKVQSDLEQMKKSDPGLYNAIKDKIIKDKKTKPKTIQDLYKTKSGQEPGRAKYILDNIKDMDETQSKEFIQDMISKGVLNSKVVTEMKKQVISPSEGNDYGLSIWDKVQKAISPSVGAAEMPMQTGGLTQPQFNPDGMFAEAKPLAEAIKQLGSVDGSGLTPTAKTVTKVISSGKRTKVSKKLLAAAGKKPRIRKPKAFKPAKIKKIKHKPLRVTKVDTSFVPQRIPSIKKLKIRFPTISSRGLKV